MPKRAKDVASYVADYIAEGEAVVKALKSVFSDTKLFPARPRAVLPRLTIRGVKTGSEVYQQETHRRCLEATVQHAILTAIRDAITAAMPQRAALSDDTVGTTAPTLPTTSNG